MADGEKRLMLLDGHTPKPSCKMFKMADVSNYLNDKEFNKKMIDKMTNC